jgi:hypothetical protein
MAGFAVTTEDAEARGIRTKWFMTQLLEVFRDAVAVASKVEARRTDECPWFSHTQNCI